MLVQRGDLTGHSISCHGCLDRPTIAMAKYKEHFDSEDCDPIFETGNNLWCRDIACHTSNKEVANCLIKYQFHRYARVSTGENGGKRLLFVKGMRFEQGEIVLNRGQLICGKALVSRD